MRLPRLPLGLRLGSLLLLERLLGALLRLHAFALRTLCFRPRACLRLLGLALLLLGVLFLLLQILARLLHILLRGLHLLLLARCFLLRVLRTLEIRFGTLLLGLDGIAALPSLLRALLAGGKRQQSDRCHRPCCPHRSPPWTPNVDGPRRWGKERPRQRLPGCLERRRCGTRAQDADGLHAAETRESAGCRGVAP